MPKLTPEKNRKKVTSSNTITQTAALPQRKTRCGANSVSTMGISAQQVRSWGPVLVARHLWETLGLDRAISAACGPKTVEAIFALTANRLIDPSWEHGMDRWLEKVFFPLLPKTGPGAAAGKTLKDSGIPSGNPWDRVLLRLADKRHAVEAAFLEEVKELCGDCDEVVLYELGSTLVERRPPSQSLSGWPAQPSERSINLRLGILICKGWPLTIRFFGSGEPTVAQIKRFIEETRRRFQFRNVFFVAPSGTDEERLRQLASQGVHHLVGVRRRRDPVAVDVIQQAGRQWERIDADTKIQEVLLPVETDAVFPAEASELDTERYFLIHSKQGEKEERALRVSVVNRALKALEALKQAVETGRLKKPATIMARAESILAERKAYRYISWRMSPQGSLDFWVAERKSSLRRAYEGISLIKTSDPDVSPFSAAALHQVLRRLDNAFDEIRDTAASRSTHLPLPDIEEQHSSKSPGNLFYGHLVVSELAFLLRCKLEKSLLQNRISVSLAEAIEALRTISLVEFRLGKEKRTAVSSGDRTAAKILRALGIQDLNPYADAERNNPAPPPK